MAADGRNYATEVEWKESIVFFKFQVNGYFNSKTKLPKNYLFRKFSGRGR